MTFIVRETICTICALGYGDPYDFWSPQSLWLSDLCDAGTLGGHVYDLNEVPARLLQEGVAAVAEQLLWHSRASLCGTADLGSCSVQLFCFMLWLLIIWSVRHARFVIGMLGMEARCTSSGS